MLKKAGIVVAAAAAGLLAVSPLAFAGDKGGHHGGHGGHGGGDKQVNNIDNERESNQLGLVNVGDVNALNDVNVCPNVSANVGLITLLTGQAAETGDTSCVNDDSVSQVNND